MTPVAKHPRRRIIAWIIGGLCFGLVMSVATAWIRGWEGIPRGVNIRDMLDVEGQPLGGGLHGEVIPEANRVTVVLARGSHFFYGPYPRWMEGPPPPPDPIPRWAAEPPAEAANSVPPGKYWRVATLTSAFGWPFRCLRSVTTRMETHPGDSRGRRSLGTVTTLEQHGIFAARNLEYERADRVLPTLPYWPGLLANTAFWGLPLPLLALGASTLRRARRKRRGLCPACAYDLSAAASPVCPECGQPRPPTPAGSSKTAPAAG